MHVVPLLVHYVQQNVSLKLLEWLSHMTTHICYRLLQRFACLEMTNQTKQMLNVLALCISSSSLVTEQVAQPFLTVILLSKLT